MAKVYLVSVEDPTGTYKNGVVTVFSTRQKARTSVTKKRKLIAAGKSMLHKKVRLVITPFTMDDDDG